MSELIRIAQTRKPDQEFGLPNSWYLEKAWGVDREFVSQLFATPGIYEGGDAYPGALNSVKQLADDHEVRIVTHKHAMPSVSRAIAEAARWYDRQGLLSLVDFVVPRGDKTSYPADIVVDDKPNLAWAQPDALNVLMNRPWNQGLIPGLFYLRAHGWQQVLDIVRYADARR